MAWLVVVVAGRGCHFGAQSRMATGRWGNGQHAQDGGPHGHKQQTDDGGSALCATVDGVSLRRQQRSVIERRCDGKAGRQDDMRAGPSVATHARYRTGERVAVGRQADMMAWQSARGDFVQIAKASSNTVAQCVGSAAW